MWFAKLAKLAKLAKKSEHKKAFTKEKKDYSQSVSSFKMMGEANSSTGAPVSGYKSGNFSVENDTKDVECFKCHKKGHYANKYPEIKAKDAKGAIKERKVDDSIVKEERKRNLSVRFASGILISMEREYPIMRYWIILSNLVQVRIGAHNEDISKIFVNTGANCNTISRKFYLTLVDRGLKCALIPGPSVGLLINLVGGQTLNVTGVT